jgi:exosortase E/protease (VPEID-CTERM system)
MGILLMPLGVEKWAVDALGLILQTALAAVVAASLFGPIELSASGKRLLEFLELPNPWWPAAISIHLGVVVGVMVLLPAASDPANPPAPSLALVLVGLVVAAGLSWALSLASLASWLRLMAGVRGHLWLPVGAGLAAVMAGWLLMGYWHSFAALTLYAASSLLRGCQYDVQVNVEQLTLGTGTFAIRVAPACSGIEGVGLVAVFLSIYLWVNRRALRFPQAAMIVPVGMLLIWLANALRVAVLVMIGSHGYPELAVGGFHSQAGWIGFLAVGLSLIVVVDRMRWLRRTVRERPIDTSGVNPSVPYLLPFLSILLIAMLTGAFSPRPEAWYFLRVAAVAGLLWAFRSRLPRLIDPSWSSLAWGLAVALGWLVLLMAKRAIFGEIATGSLDPPDTWQLVVRLIGYVVTVPLAEELAFRGFLMRRLVDRNFDEVDYSRVSPLAIAVSGVLFGLMHGSLWFPGCLAGIVYGCIARSSRLGGSIAAHAATNATIAAFALFSGDFSLLS